MERLQIETGIKKYEIVDENGDVLGVIRIDPKDFNMYERVEIAEKNIEELMNAAIKIADGDGADLIKETRIVELDEKIKEQLNYLFDYDVSGIIFGNKNCLNLNHGVTFIQRFLDMIIPVIRNVVETESKESAERVGKYTNAYKNDFDVLPGGTAE